jgi:hypothetical protein
LLCKTTLYLWASLASIHTSCSSYRPSIRNGKASYVRESRSRLRPRYTLAPGLGWCRSCMCGGVSRRSSRTAFGNTSWSRLQTRNGPGQPRDGHHRKGQTQKISCAHARGRTPSRGRSSVVKGPSRCHKTEMLTSVDSKQFIANLQVRTLIEVYSRGRK